MELNDLVKRDEEIVMLLDKDGLTDEQYEDLLEEKTLIETILMNSRFVNLGRGGENDMLIDNAGMAKAIAEELLHDMAHIAELLVELHDRHERYGPQFEKWLPEDFRKSWEADIEKVLQRMRTVSSE